MNYVSYLRVSTQRQGASGLGLEAQRQTVAAFIKAGDNLRAEHIEVESGKRADRPELARAIQECKAGGATLLVSKLDRLSRSVSFIFALRDSGVPFVCADLPECNTLTLGLFATIAQHERELIGQRTRSALAAKKQQGHRLGVCGKANLIVGDASVKASAARRKYARADPSNKAATELAKLYRATGHSDSSIARELNFNGHRTRRGKEFKPMSVTRLLARAD